MIEHLKTIRDAVRILPRAFSGERNAALTALTALDALEAAMKTPAATVIKHGADRQWMSERLGHMPDGIYSLYLAAPSAQQAQALITKEDSLRFRLDCTKEQLEAAERECAELRSKLKEAQQAQPSRSALDLSMPMTFGGCPFCGRQSCVAGQCQHEKAQPVESQNSANLTLNAACVSGVRAEQAQAEAVPQGWKLVPVEPTEAMLQEAARAWTPGVNHLEAHAIRYQAMLATAPQKEQSK